MGRCVHGRLKEGRFGVKLELQKGGSCVKPELPSSWGVQGQCRGPGLEGAGLLETEGAVTGCLLHVVWEASVLIKLSPSQPSAPRRCDGSKAADRATCSWVTFPIVSFGPSEPRGQDGWERIY